MNGPKKEDHQLVGWSYDRTWDVLLRAMQSSTENFLLGSSEDTPLYRLHTKMTVNAEALLDRNNWLEIKSIYSL